MCDAMQPHELHFCYMYNRMTVMCTSAPACYTYNLPVAVVACMLQAGHLCPMELSRLLPGSKYPLTSLGSMLTVKEEQSLLSHFTLYS